MAKDMEDRIVKAIRRTWNYIAADLLEVTGYLTQQDALEALADYLTMHGDDTEAVKVFFDLSMEEQARIGKVAMPASGYCA